MWPLLSSQITIAFHMLKFLFPSPIPTTNGRHVCSHYPQVRVTVLKIRRSLTFLCYWRKKMFFFVKILYWSDRLIFVVFVILWCRYWLLWWYIDSALLFFKPRLLSFITSTLRSSAASVAAYAASLSVCLILPFCLACRAVDTSQFTTADVLISFPREKKIAVRYISLFNLFILGWLYHY